MTHGAVSMKMAEGMAEVVNGHFMKGMKKVLGGFFENRKANKEYEKKTGNQKIRNLRISKKEKAKSDFLLLCLRFLQESAPAG